MSKKEGNIDRKKEDKVGEGKKKKGGGGGGRRARDDNDCDARQIGSWRRAVGKGNSWINFS